MFHRTIGGLWLSAALAVLWHSQGPTQELSAEEIVARSIQAMGGSGPIEAVRTLRFEFRPPGEARSIDIQILLYVPFNLSMHTLGE